MVKLSYIGIFTKGDQPSRTLAQAFYTPSYNRFTQGSAHTFLAVIAKGIAQDLDPNKLGPDMPPCEEHPDFRMGFFVREGVCSIILSDIEYDGRVGAGLARKVVDEFLTKHPKGTWPPVPPKSPVTSSPISFPELSEYLTKYQNPGDADNIARIQKELDATKIQLSQTIESLMERGEKISDLVNKSDELSASSKLFYTQAKKQNSCCVVM